MDSSLHFVALRTKGGTTLRCRGQKTEDRRQRSEGGRQLSVARDRGARKK